MIAIKNLLLLIVILYSSILYSQSYDSTVYKDYYLVINTPIARITRFNIGIERVKPINDKLKYSSLITFSGGLLNGNAASQRASNPAFYWFCLQPFHLLVGRKKLQFETGPSVVFLFLRLFGKKYKYDGPNMQFYDFVDVIYLVGTRYTFPRRQIAIKCMVGSRYRSSLQHNWSYFNPLQAGELGFNWRFRSKVRVARPLPD